MDKELGHHVVDLTRDYNRIAKEILEANNKLILILEQVLDEDEEVQVIGN